MRVLQLVPGAIFSALRAYALGRSKLVGLVVLTLSLAPVGANLVHFGFDPIGENYPIFGCEWSDSVTDAINQRYGSRRCISYVTDDIEGVVILISRVPLIVADMLLIYITWTKLNSRRALGSKRLSLSDILFRDGTTYFIVLFILNVLHLVLSESALFGFPETVGISDVTLFTGPLSSLLVSRFLLDLQEADRMVVGLDVDNPLYFSTRNPWDDTTSFISSLGAFINPDLPPLSEDDYESESHMVSRTHGEEEGGAQASDFPASSPLCPP
ncbi:hypothetical protein K466DRAFT_660052 [Polyporus arcularius HHB13444]|uniref:Uncharacterized protein n=1 Tax=Polyporus arcularius HHB13444 TaxID=1314778 RepID=A0A5C3PP07_9APHY|nr:hypothetical protein K466DRAFT_660052 [Polyporus arcularius HHB13444]